MDKTVVRMVSHGSFLGTRFLGAEVREEILNACSSGRQVILDFEGVTSVSHSFADECIGRLLDEIGPVAFKERMRFKDTTDEINSLLRVVTKRRMKDAVPVH